MKVYRLDLSQLDGHGNKNYDVRLDVAAATAQQAIKRATTHARKLPDMLKSQPIAVKSCQEIVTELL